MLLNVVLRAIVIRGPEMVGTKRLGTVLTFKRKEVYQRTSWRVTLMAYMQYIAIRVLVGNSIGSFR